jgi:hypothetical protein
VWFWSWYSSNNNVQYSVLLSRGIFRQKWTPISTQAYNLQPPFAANISCIGMRCLYKKDAFVNIVLHFSYIGSRQHDFLCQCVYSLCEHLCWRKPHFCLHRTTNVNQQIKERKFVTVRSQFRPVTLFYADHSNTGVVGSNRISDINICMRLFCVCIVLCVGRGLAMSWSPDQGVLLTIHRITKLKKRPGPNKGQ